MNNNRITLQSHFQNRRVGGLGCTCGLLVLFGWLVPSYAFADIVYDLESDWSDVNNPNGVWSYNNGNGPITNQVSDWLPNYFSTDQPAWARSDRDIVSWFKSTNNKEDFQVGDVITHT